MKFKIEITKSEREIMRENEFAVSDLQPLAYALFELLGLTDDGLRADDEQFESFSRLFKTVIYDGCEQEITPVLTVDEMLLVGRGERAIGCDLEVRCYDDAE